MVVGDLHSVEAGGTDRESVDSHHGVVGVLFKGVSSSVVDFTGVDGLWDKVGNGPGAGGIVELSVSSRGDSQVAVISLGERFVVDEGFSGSGLGGIRLRWWSPG